MDLHIIEITLILKLPCGGILAKLPTSLPQFFSFPLLHLENMTVKSFASTPINCFSMVSSQFSYFRPSQQSVSPYLLCELCQLLTPSDKLKFLSILQILSIFHLDFHPINLKSHTTSYLTILLLCHVTLPFF